MAWPLFSAVLRCLARRGWELCLRAPVPAAVAVAAFILAPLALARATSSVARSSGAALADPAAARIIVAALLLPAVAAGAAASRAVPGPDRLGAALVSAPVRRATAALAAALPTALAALAFVPLAASVTVPFAAAAPGGLPAAGALGAAMVAGVVLGAAVTQLTAATRRGSFTSVLLLAALAVCVSFAALAGALDPTPHLADVLAGRGSAGPVVVAAAGATLAAAAAWLLGLRSGHRAARRRVVRLRLRAPIERLPVVSLALVVLLRRTETRGAVIAGAVLGIVGAAAGGAVGLEADGAVLLGLSSVLAAGVVAPLAVGGAVDELRWLLATGPLNHGRAAAGWLAAASAVSAVSLVPLVCLAAAHGVLTARAAGAFALGALLAAGCGVLAGSIAVWRPGAVGDQALSLTILAVVSAGAGALALGSGWLGGLVGVDDRWSALAVTAVPLVAASVALARRLRPARC